MKRYRRNIILCAAVLALAVVTMATTLQKRGLKAEYAAPEEATPIQEGVMTEKQKEHGKIYKGYAAMVGHKKIKDLVAAQGDVDIWAPISCPQYMPRIELGRYLQNLTCEADAVVYGLVKSKSSHLVESGTFLFTDYEVSASEVLKAHDAAPLRQGENITVTRGGGTALLNKRLVRAIDPNRGRLEVGEYYLFYLKRISPTGGYRPFGNEVSEDTFRLHKDTIGQVSSKQWPIGQSAKVDAALFLSEARNAAASSCEQGRLNK